jgi:LysM repeat protein
MLKIPAKLTQPAAFKDIPDFVQFVRYYLKLRGYNWFKKLEVSKDFLVDILYMKRGRYARPFLHFGMVVLVFLVATLGPLILSQQDIDAIQTTTPVLATTQAQAPDFYTLQAEAVRQFRGGEIITHVVEEDETISTIAERYGLSVNTILWENNLKETSTIKPGMELKILPLDGVRHRVKRGETIYTIASRYGLDRSQAQMIVDYPFNEFLSDETFELVAGQWLMVPDGVKPAESTTPAAAPRVAKVPLTPDAGSVVAQGSFVWPAAGRITQGYRFYHRAIDIANQGAGPILAADAGVVTSAGWNGGGYGNAIVIDHGNGFQTLYAHLSAVQVQVGQRVGRGNVVGQMGTTGRSTGIHLHFEIRHGGTLVNPLNYL